MKIGITQQPEISREILELIDFIEVKDLDSDNVRPLSKYQKPFLFHAQNFGERKRIFVADDDLVDLLKNKKTKEIINSSGFSFFSLHLGLPVKSYKFDDNSDYVATSPPLTQKEFFNKVSDHLQKIKKLYPNFKLLLETPPFVPHRLSKGAYYYICDPDFIHQVLNENNCCFLLDIAHTTVSAYNLGFKKPKDYFFKLPLDKTVEIHIHRPRYRKEEGIWRDAHFPITNKEIESLRFILSKAKNAQALTLEAAGLHDEETLINELKKLKERI